MKMEKENQKGNSAMARNGAFGVIGTRP